MCQMAFILFIIGRFYTRRRITRLHELGQTYVVRPVMQVETRNPILLPHVFAILSGLSGLNVTFSMRNDHED